MGVVLTKSGLNSNLSVKKDGIIPFIYVQPGVQSDRAETASKTMRRYDTLQHLNKQHNSMIHKDKKDFTKSKSAELKQAAKKKDIGATFKILRELTGQHSMAPTSLKAPNGETIYDQSQCLGLWKKHFEIQLNSDPPDCINPGLVAAATEATAASDGEEFSPEEVRSAVKKPKSNKAAGTCGIVSELLTTGSPAMIL